MRQVFQLLHSCCQDLRICYNHIKAHVGNGWNELADVLAKKAAKGQEHAAPPQCVIKAVRDNDLQWLWAFASTVATHQLPLCQDGTVRWQEDARCSEGACLDAAHLIPAAGQPTAARHNVLEMKLVSANAQGLQLKYRYIEEQLLYMGCNVAIFQESKGKAGMVTSSHFLRMASDSAGVWGCEIWISRKHGIGHCGGKNVFVDVQDIKVVHEGHRILAVQIALTKFSLLIVAGHAPHMQRPKEERDSFFDDLDTIAKTSEWCSGAVIGIDLNGRMPAMVGQATGELEPDLPDQQGIFFANWMEQRGFCAPNTFASMHSGEQQFTWRHSSGATARIDYWAVRGGWIEDSLSTWIEAFLDLANQQEDHWPISMTLSWRIGGWSGAKLRRRKIDREKIVSNEGREILQRELKRFSGVSWEVHPDAHCRQIEEHLHDIIDEHFVAPSNAPKASYISEAVWRVRACRLALKRRVALTSRERDWLKVQAALQTWKGRGGAFYAWCRKRCLLYEVFAGALNFSGHTLKRILKQDKLQMLEQLAQGYGGLSGNALVGALRRAGIGRKQQGRVAKPLPSVSLSNNPQLSRRAELDELWMKHFGEQEQGQIMTVNSFLHEVSSYQPDGSQVDWDKDLMPTLAEIEDLCRKVSPRKAFGLDDIPGELFAAEPGLMARLYQPLMFKTTAKLQQPLQWAGGVLVEAYKGSGLAAEVESFRSLFIASVPGKVYHQFLRSKLGTLIQDIVASTHFGARKGAPVVLPALAVRLFGCWARDTGQSIALLFLDIRSAYYRVLREVAVGRILTDVETIMLFKRFQLTEDDLHELMEAVRGGGLVREAGMGSHLAALVRDLYARTWFVTPYSSGDKVCYTKAGSRPGEAWADVIFTFIFDKVMKKIKTRLTDLDVCTALPFSGVPEPWQDSDMNNSAEFLAAIWADDAVYPVADKDPRRMLLRLKTTASVVLDTCASFGLEANLKPGKTSILLKMRGRNSRQAAREHFPVGRSELCCQRATTQTVAIPIVPLYKHLGGLLDPDFQSMPEAKRRGCVAASAFDCRAKQLFHNRHVPLATKSGLFPGLITPTYFNLAIWEPTGKAWAHMEFAYARLVCRLLWNRCQREDYFRVAPALAFECTRVLPLHLIAAQRRIGMLIAIVETDSPAIWALLQLEKHWLKTLTDDFRALLPSSDGWPSFSSDSWPLWWHTFKSRKAEVKRAAKHRTEHLFDEYLAAEAKQLLLADMYREALREVGNVEGVPQWTCGPCRRAFKSKAGLATHFFRKHQRRAEYRFFARGSVCAACGTDYHGYCRLLAHLRAWTDCVDRLRELGLYNTDVQPGFGSREWRKRQRQEFHPAPPVRQVGVQVPPNTTDGLGIQVADEAYLELCERLFVLEEVDKEQCGHELLLEILAQFPLYPDECIAVVDRVRQELVAELLTNGLP